MKGFWAMNIEAAISGPWPRPPRRIRRSSQELGS
jgi:hypothetical protein